MLRGVDLFTFFFFFSSRRRHTRCSRDWSSDVCSSDLVAKRVDGVMTPLGPAQEFQVVVEGQENMSVADRTALVEFQQKAVRLQRAVKIGRASCRERV